MFIINRLKNGAKSAEADEASNKTKDAEDTKTIEAKKQVEAEANRVPIFSSLTRYFTRPIPWFVLFILSTYLLLKSQDVYFNSPCAILGMNEPLSYSLIKKKFRNISMCTHPDRLRGRLGRVPTEAEVKRGMVLFNRASKAKDALTDTLKSAESSRERRNKRRAKKGMEPLPDVEDLYCREGNFDKRIYVYVKDTWEWVLAVAKNEMEVDPLVGYGKLEVLYYFLKQVSYEVYVAYYAAITFENGFMSSLLLLLWTLFLYRMLQSFFSWLWKIGITKLPFELVRVLIISPFPTAVRFFVLIPIRYFVFFKTEAVEWMKEKKPRDSTSTVGEKECDCANCQSKKQRGPCDCANCKAKDEEEDVAGVTDMPTTAGLLADTTENRLRARKRLAKGKEAQRTQAEIAKAEQQLVQEADKAADQDDDDSDDEEAADESTKDDGILDIVQRRVKGKEMMARSVGVRNVQVEMLIVLTKPVLPLLMVVCTGQVWSGLITSTLMWEVMRKIPSFHYETLHLFCVLFGFLHTWIGVTPDEIENRAGGAANQRLLWEWNFRDCVFILFLIMAGALAQSYSRLGNEPYFTSSFGSGVVMRILLTTDFVQDFGFVQYLSGLTTDLLSAVNIEVTTSDEMVTYSGGGIGGCGGGMFEMFVGEEYSSYLALLAKIVLMALPLLCTMQWVVRALRGIKANRTAKFTLLRRFPRIIYRSWLAFFGLVQIIFLATLSFNEAHGGMTSFYMTVMVGVVLESFLATFDIRGPMRSLIFVFIFALS